MLAGYLEEPEYFIDEDGEFQVGETVMMQFTALLLKLAPRYDLAESVTVLPPRRGPGEPGHRSGETRHSGELLGGSPVRGFARALRARVRRLRPDRPFGSGPSSPTASASKRAAHRGHWGDDDVQGPG
jgi:hypothetical protein